MRVYFEIMRNEITVLGNTINPTPYQKSAVDWWECYRVYMHLDYGEVRVIRI